ncbi:hypothetical protein TUBRATIS_10960 [Tubulinosema ratisbonensis]|uniref:Uncharacterized protein n=1 Tax=Tubulinosema ratisbonensis TaxID=291195 RepID=A0A437AMH4_9MICR|nr:hypothetical protein TUBRATIS_10960 [Tubulinosema ratisbonensis]
MEIYHSSRSRYIQGDDGFIEENDFSDRHNSNYFSIRKHMFLGTLIIECLTLSFSFYFLNHTLYKIIPFKHALIFILLSFIFTLCKLDEVLHRKKNPICFYFDLLKLYMFGTLIYFYSPFVVLTKFHFYPSILIIPFLSLASIVFKLDRTAIVENGSIYTMFLVLIFGYFLHTIFYLKSFVIYAIHNNVFAVPALAISILILSLNVIFNDDKSEKELLQSSIVNFFYILCVIYFMNALSFYNSKLLITNGIQ